MIPLNNNVIVKRSEKKLTTESGIILQRNDDADFADVISVGPDVVDVTVGEKVLLDWNKAIKIDKENFKISVDNIIAVAV
jgi:co-chaperonin GroES (HSP10)